MKKLIVIPARGGSKGIPEKNIFPLNGKPLITYTLDMLSANKLTDTDISVSTDSVKIMDVVKAYDNITIINRPEDISGDTASTESALLHALSFMDSEYGRTYDAVITLQPTSPLRKFDTLLSFICAYENSYPEYNALLSLTEDRTDFWILDDNGKYERLQKNAPRRRQGRKPLYAENSAYYITDVNALRESGSVLGTSVNGFIIPSDEALDINYPVDITIAECLLRNRATS